MTDYSAALNAAAARIGSPCRGDELLDIWDSFVADAEDGYGFTVFEYDAEIAVRDKIERLLADPELSGFPGHADFRRSIIPMDDRFRAQLRPEWRIPRIPPGWDSWWRLGILRRAGGQYADYWREQGFDVEVMERRSSR